MYNQQKSNWQFSDGELEKHFGPHVVITNCKWFIEHADEIESWLDNCTTDWRLQGIVITFSSKQEQTLFKLAWGNQ